MYICHICLVVLDVDLLQIQRQWPGKIMVDEMLPPRGSCEYYKSPLRQFSHIDYTSY